MASADFHIMVRMCYQGLGSGMGGGKGTLPIILGQSKKTEGLLLRLGHYMTKLIRDTALKVGNLELMHAKYG